MTTDERILKIEKMVEALFQDRFPNGEGSDDQEREYAWRALRRGDKRPMDEFEKKRKEGA